MPITCGDLNNNIYVCVLGSLKQTRRVQQIHSQLMHEVMHYAVLYQFIIYILYNSKYKVFCRVMYRYFLGYPIKTFLHAPCRLFSCCSNHQ